MGRVGGGNFVQVSLADEGDRALLGMVEQPDHRPHQLKVVY